MENKLIVTGTTQYQLMDALNLAFSLKYDIVRSECKGVWCWGVDKDGETIYFMNNAVPNKLCNNKFPCILNTEILMLILIEWLKQFEVKSMGGDGSYGKGWTLELGRWSDDFDIKVNFETMYYGK